MGAADPEQETGPLGIDPLGPEIFNGWIERLHALQSNDFFYQCTISAFPAHWEKSQPIGN